MLLPATARDVLAAMQALLDETTPAEAGNRPGPDAWSPVMLLGHLIDSACNNHQRFVRLQFGDLEQFPAYDQDAWAAAQNCAAFDWETLKRLWRDYNALLLHVIAAAPESAGKNAWITPKGPLTLEFLIEDYHRHLQWHVTHYAGRLAEIRAAG